MTPKEKAEQLVDSFRNQIVTYLNDFMSIRNAKRCALICVDEIIDILELNGFSLQEYHDKGTLEYWLHVKDEIQIVTNELTEQYYNETYKNEEKSC
jgi:hypothetical protein